MTCERFFALYDPVYYWTFTFREAHSYWRYSLKWRWLMKRLVYCGAGKRGEGLYPGLCGIRVTEVHPAEFSHGLHWHMICNMRLDVGVINRLAEPIGLGYCWVDKVRNPVALGNYLKKYLGKVGPKLLRGMRKWDTFGGFTSNKVNDVVLDSIFTRNMKHAFRGHQTSYCLSSLVLAISNMFGEWDNWPVGYRSMVTPCNNFGSVVGECRRRLERDFVLCPDYKGDWSADEVVFWSVWDADAWGKRFGRKLLKVELCAKCGALHGRFAGAWKGGGSNA